MLTGKKYTPADFAAMILRRKWWIVVPAIVCGYAALIVSSRLVDQFQSEMLIQIVPQRVPDAFVRSTVTIRTEDRMNALSQQVESRTELERLITQMDLYPRERETLPMQDVVERMRSKIVVDIVKSTQDSRDAEAFFIRFTYPDRDIAAQVTDRLGALFIDMNSRDRGSLADATNNFLETQLNEARQRLEEQEHKIEQFRQRNSGRLPSQVDFNMQAIQNAQLQLQAQVESLARDRDRKLMLERLYNDAQTEPVLTPQPTPAAAAPAPAGDAAVAAGGGTSEQQLIAMKDALARLELRLKPEHPDVRRTRRRIQDLEKQVAEERSAAAQPQPAPERPVVATITTANQARRDRLQQMQAEIESLDRQIQFKEGEQQRLQRTVGEYQARIEQTPGVESESISIMRDYATMQEAYKGLREKSEQSKVAAELEKRQIGEQFRVLDAARPPLRATGVPRLQVNAVGVLLGLGLGVLLAAFLEFRDTSVHRAEDVVEVFKLPVIALLPALIDETRRKQIRRQRVLIASATAVVVLAGGYGFWALQLWKHLT